VLPVASLSAPSAYGPTSPPKFPNELTNAIPAAAEDRREEAQAHAPDRRLREIRIIVLHHHARHCSRRGHCA